MSNNLNLAKYRKGSDAFEIVVNPDQAMHFKKHPETDIRDALVYPQIYADAKKGLLASEQRLEAVFGTTDPIEIAKKIIKEGEVQVTAEYRQEQREQKKKRILDIIRMQGVDPRTNAPHPLTRIENALEQAKVRIDEQTPAEQQVPAIIKALRPILPIKLVTKELKVTIPAQYAPRAFPIIKSYGKILKETWLSNGAWEGKIEIPGGLENDFYDKLNNLTQGNAETTLVSTKGEEI